MTTDSTANSLWHLSAKEKQGIIRRECLWPAIVVVLLLIGSIGLWQWSDEQTQKEKSATPEITKQLVSIQEKLRKVAQEEQEIIDKTAIFQAMERRGFFAPENLLDTQEVLYGTAKANHISEFEYSIPERGERKETIEAKLITPVGLANQKKDEPIYKKVEAIITVFKFDLKMQHEAQLFAFLADLAPDVSYESSSLTEVQKTYDKDKGIRQPSALTRLKSCEVKKIQPEAPLSPTQPNFVANCVLEWIRFMRV